MISKNNFLSFIVFSTCLLSLNSCGIILESILSDYTAPTRTYLRVDSNFGCSLIGNMPYVKGSVENTASYSIENIELTATGYDSEGNIIETKSFNLDVDLTGYGYATFKEYFYSKSVTSASVKVSYCN